MLMQSRKIIDERCLHILVKDKPSDWKLVTSSAPSGPVVPCCLANQYLSTGRTSTILVAVNTCICKTEGR